MPVDIDSEAESAELSVEEIEALLQSKPDDLALKKDLAYALLDQYTYGAENHEAFDKKDLKRLRALLKDIPIPNALLPRSFVAYLDKKIDESVKWLALYVDDIVDSSGSLGADELQGDIYYLFGGAESIFWAKLLQSENQKLGKSAAGYFVSGLASADITDIAASFYKQALDKDRTFWLAAQNLAYIYAVEKNWHSAAMFFEKALESESEWVQENADLHSAYSWCLRNLKRYAEEEKQLRDCLRIDSDYACQNDLGWCLYKQGRYQEALTIFEKAIEQGVDGKFPYYNRARTLAKLNRHAEAVDAWRAFNPDGRLPSTVQVEIGRLQRRMARGLPDTPVSHENFERDQTIGVDDQIEEIDDEVAVETNDMPISARRTSSDAMASPKEILLEESIERLIKLEKPVFGRKLKIYQADGQPYGRQFPIQGGRIDLLTEDLDTGDLLVIELKKDGDSDDVLGQIATYMVWVRENVAKQNQKVGGLICVFSASPKLRMSVRAVPGLELFEYGFSFSKI